MAFIVKMFCTFAPKRVRGVSEPHANFITSYGDVMMTMHQDALCLEQAPR